MTRARLWINAVEAIQRSISGAAFSVLAPRLALDATSRFTYQFDGQTLSLPIPSTEEYEKSIATKADFEEPRWLPVVVSLRSERRKDAEIREASHV
jgi:hypothetical protein